MGFLPGQVVRAARGPFANDNWTQRMVVRNEPPRPGEVPLESGDVYHWMPEEWLEVVEGTSTTVVFDPARPRLTPGRTLALGALFAAGPQGLTDFELAQRTGRKQTSIGKRRGELVSLGLVESRLVTRPSDTLTPSRVWAITPLGVDAWHRLQPKEQAS